MTTKMLGGAMNNDSYHCLELADYLFDDDLSKIEKYGKDKLLIFSLTDWSGSKYDYVEKMHDIVNAGFRTAWIFDISYQPRSIDMPRNVPILFLPNMILNVYFCIYKQKLSHPSSAWSPDHGKFLFLTGKPDAPNRGRLLYDLYKNGMLDQAIYSFFPPDNQTLLKKQFTDITNEEYQNFIDAVKGSPDGVVPSKSARSIHYAGVPFDPSLFSSTSFRLISETWRDNRVWITEKTYITILNHQPFIMAAWPGTLSALEKMGFKTFNEYLPIPDYDSIIDHRERLSAVIENTRFWLKNISQDQDQIKSDIEHNFYHFHIKADEYVKQLEDFAWHCGIDANPYLMLPLYDITDDWIRFYYKIKAQSWPDCYHHNQFHELPSEIQQECIEVFGYQPKNINNY